MDLPGILSDIMKDLVALNKEAADSNPVDVHSLYPSSSLFSFFLAAHPFPHFCCGRSTTNIKQMT